jgi:carboxymethylenebutenolidase
MCHADDSRPPSPPDPGAVGMHGRLVLESTDGARFAAYTASPADGSRGGIVILPDVRGLHPYYEQLAVRFAEAGFHAVVIDWFGRTLGTGPRQELPNWQELSSQVRPDEVLADARAAIEHLRGLTAEPLFAVGFCFGGSQSWRLGASDLELAGCIGFYGKPIRIADVEEAIHRPLLMLVAGADAATPLGEFQELDARLTARGQAHTMVVYDGAPHSFFDRAFDQWRPACEDAWRQILDFTARYGTA